MKRLVGALVMVASLGVTAGSAHADTRPVACVWPYVTTRTGVCVYWYGADSQ